jgi:hypothetical protein
MLHSLPAVLEELERCLLVGDDPTPLLGSIRWPDVIDWPRNALEARELKQRLASIHELINGLLAPLRATLMGLNQDAAYQNRGCVQLPSSLSLRFQQSV